MLKNIYNPTLLLVLAALSIFSCDDDDEKPSLRAEIDYSLLTAETTYSELFVDEDGATTVDLTEGNQRHKMFQALNYYSSSSISANAHIDAAKLKSLFSNTGDPFTDISTATISVSGDELNSSDVQLKNVVASSRPATEAEAARTRIESLFDEIDAASNSINSEASQGQAGKLGNYLVDERGIEIIQIIQKSLIGALQVDYISNVLLDEGLNADNSELVGDNNYTQLEHNWDEAYGFLTLNPIYLEGATAGSKGSIVEAFLGSYIWEYNRDNFANIYPAFLKGRAAIVNNDKEELQKQAIYIRTQMEKTLANSAVNYLEKWKTGESEGARAHAIGEGLGFIYSLRFATIHNVDAAFSDTVLNDLIGSENGFWDLNADKINAAQDAIKAKFGL